MLQPTADGFRNYFGDGNWRSLAEMLVERADLLSLTVLLVEEEERLMDPVLHENFIERILV